LKKSQKPYRLDGVSKTVLCQGATLVVPQMHLKHVGALAPGRNASVSPFVEMRGREHIDKTAKEERDENSRVNNSIN
jgi:hypothetical protein